MSSENVYKIGELVRCPKSTYGLPEKCMENMEKTIRPNDNVRIEKDTIGMIVGYLGNYHTLMYLVCWGGSLCGMKLFVTDNKFEKLQPVCNNSLYSSGGGIDVSL